MSTLWRKMMVGLLAVALVVAGSSWLPRARVYAQGNLLVNGSLERPYYGQGSATQTVPQGWNLWVGAGNPTAFPHNDKVQVIDGEVSWNLRQGYVVFTAAGYQRVTGLTAGDAIKLTAYGWVYTCNDTVNSCIIEQAPYRRSDTSAGASLKVGIDPTGGTDPLSTNVVWSAGAAPYDQWATLSVVAEAKGDAVTVFLWMTQAAGLSMNNVYWDNASLVRTDEAPVTGTDGTIQQPPAEVPFVVPQGVRPDGSIMHTVQEGDTLSSIAFAYSQDYDVTIQSIADLNDGIQPNTRFLQLGQQLMILPPGSVDPTTGQLLSGGQTAAPSGDSTGTPAADAAGDSTEPTAERPSSAPTQPPTPTAMAEDEDPVASAANADPTTEPTVEPTAKPTSEPTTEPTEAPVEPTEEPTSEPTAEPTATVEPTAVAMAPEAADSSEEPSEGESALTVETGTLCAEIFDDANTNQAFDQGESLIAGSQVVLGQTGSADTMYDVTDPVAPLCIDLDPGIYTLEAMLPAGYGPTTATSASVRVARGLQVTVPIGGAQGYTPPEPPAPDDAAAEQTAPETGAVAPIVEVVVDSGDEETGVLDRIEDNIGLFVLGFAGVVLVSGTILFMGLRRITR